jgi:hypothetical protein
MNIQFKDGYVAKFDLKELKSGNPDDEIAKNFEEPITQLKKNKNK